MLNEEAATESTAAMPEQEPIDYIDLTEDSPANRRRVLRQQNINNVNLPNVRSRTLKTRKRNLHTQPTIQHEDSAIIEIPDSNANHVASASTNAAAVEIIELDETASPKHTGTCFLNDSVNCEIVLLTCPICFEKLSSRMKPTSTQCGHIFCARCLELAMNKKKKCPTCQRAVKLKSCTRLYF